MAEVLLFHHVQGLTPGVVAFADDLRAARAHRAHAGPVRRAHLRLHRGGVRARSRGVDADALADRAVEALPADLVFAGFSYGVGPAQRLAQTRPGARGALLFHACFPITGEWAFGPWPDGVPVQVHGMDADPFFALEGDLDAARELVETVGPPAELFVYPGDQHLFADRSLPSYDEDAAALLTKRVLDFLAAK